MNTQGETNKATSMHAVFLTRLTGSSARVISFNKLPVFIGRKLPVFYVIGSVLFLRAAVVKKTDVSYTIQVILFLYPVPDTFISR